MKNFGLFTIACLLFIALAPVLLAYALLEWCYFAIHPIKKTKSVQLGEYFFILAKSIDQTGNVVGAPLFNRILIKRNGFRFGHEDETISSVLGRNQLNGRLTKLGHWLANLLDTIDPGHCQRAIGQ